jgi:hypothetical protein
MGHDSDLQKIELTLIPTLLDRRCETVNRRSVDGETD